MTENLDFAGVDNRARGILPGKRRILRRNRLYVQVNRDRKTRRMDLGEGRIGSASRKKLLLEPVSAEVISSDLTPGIRSFQIVPRAASRRRAWAAK